MLLLPYVGIAQTLEIHQINVGQGSATLVLAKNDLGHVLNAILIDAGRGAAAVKNIRAYLRDRNIQLHAAYLTHYDADHIGGFSGTLAIPGLFQTEPITHVYDRGDQNTPGTAVYRRYIRKINKHHITRSTLTSTQRDTLFNEGPSTIVLQTLAVNATVGHTPYTATNENDRSAVFRLVFGDFTFLIAGDLSGRFQYSNPGYASTSVTRQRAHDFFNTDVGDAVQAALGGAGAHVCGYLVSHHGANNAFTGIATTTVALIASGRHAGYKHPRAELLLKLAAMNAFFYCTAYNFYDRDDGSGARQQRGEFASNLNGRDIVVIVDRWGKITVNGKPRNCKHHKPLTSLPTTTITHDEISQKISAISYIKLL